MANDFLNQIIAHAPALMGMGILGIVLLAILGGLWFVVRSHEDSLRREAARRAREEEAREAAESNRGSQANRDHRANDEWLSNKGDSKP